MTTFRVDSEDFRKFIDWMIKKGTIENDWAKIREVYKSPYDWLPYYLEFQEETHEEETER